MPLIKLQFKPGIDKDQTDYSNEGGWRACNLIRFRSGYPEKVGGWVKYVPEAFLGTCRQMWNWVTSYGDNFLAFGTNTKVYIEQGGNFYGITPLQASFTTTDTDNCISTTNSSTTVTVELGTAHTASDGDYVEIDGVTGSGDAIGGIPVSEINDNHAITVVNSTAFTITVDTTATSTNTSAGGTAITVGVELSPGNAIPTLGYGWGTGTWSRGAWGLGSTSPIDLPQRDWWFDNFDNDLFMNIRNGAGYVWERGTTSDLSTALATHAIPLTTYASNEGYTSADVPVKIMQLMVSQQDKHLLAFGAVPYGSSDAADFDPLLIRWTDQDNPGQWAPTAFNSAGFLRVSRGSAILRALPTRQEVLVWTDTSLNSLQFLGTTDVFGLQEYSNTISLMSSRAVAYAGNVAYWMGKDKFYAYTGRVETLPCTLRNHVFNNINLNQYQQVVCGTNEQWNEIWWFYPSASSTYNDSYVKYNHLERVWDYGSLERTAWLDIATREFPQAANTSQDATSGYLYDHENGLDDDGSAMNSYIESSDFDLDDGDKFMLVRRIIPDLSFSTSTAASPQATVLLRHRNFPGNDLSSDSEDMDDVILTDVDEYTTQLFLRARARQMAIKVYSDTTGVQWQLGTPRLDVRPDGRR